MNPVSICTLIRMMIVPWGGGGFDSVTQFLRVIGDRVGMPIVDHAVPCDNLNLSYSTLHSSYLQRVTDPIEKRERIRILLDNVSKQTGLTFQFKRQKVDVWFLKEGPLPGA